MTMPDLRHEPMSRVFDKWHIGGLPRAAVLHRFTAPDSGPPHDHPWGFRSFLIAGGYTERVFELDGTSKLVTRYPGDSFSIAADHIHKIERILTDECWTLILPGPKERDSGFYEFRDGEPWHRYWHEHEFVPYDRVEF